MRKKIFALVIVLLSFFSQKSFAKVCSGMLTFDTIPYSYVDTATYRLEIVFNQGDIINFIATITGYSSQQCSCVAGPVYWFHDSMMVTGLSYNIIDTGVFTVNYNSTSFGGSCSAGWGSRIFHVGYRTATAISEANPIANFLVYPTLSNGIFKVISDDRDLKQLMITDGSGRVVLAITKKFSEINLTNFSPGIYYYAITDEKENIFRGRIVKEE